MVEWNILILALMKDCGRMDREILLVLCCTQTKTQLKAAGKMTSSMDAES